MNLHLVDWNADALDSAKSSITTKGTVQTHKLDVSSLSDWDSLKANLAKSNTKLDLLHLNAGIGGESPWTDPAPFRKIFDVNLFGIINGLNTFAADFDGNTAGEQKAVIITGSKQGITNPPGRPAYNATKAAVKALAEHLNYDFAQSSPHTSVHMLVPGWTFTGLTGGGGLKEKPAGAWAPEQVADYLYKKMGEGKFYVICPDNDVDWETDRKRMTWTMGDAVFERQPLSRWRGEYKEEAARTMEKMELRGRQEE